MDSLDNWIYPLAKRAITEYLETLTTQTDKKLGRDGQLACEDDGSNLRFRNSAVHEAQIVKWSEEQHRTQAVLCDATVTIKAVFSRSALRTYRSTSFDHSPIQHGSEGCHIQLKNFQIVFEHSRNTPDVHLYIEDFHIDKSRRSSRLSNTQPILKTGNIYELTKQTLRHIKESKGTMDDRGEDYLSDGSIKSQTDIPSRSRKDQRNMSDNSQELFATQVAPAQHPRMPDSTTAPVRRGPALAKELLGVLGSRARVAGTQVRPEGPLPANNPQIRNGSQASTPNKVPEQPPRRSLPLDSNRPVSQQDTIGEHLQFPAQESARTLSQPSSYHRIDDVHAVSSSAPVDNHANPSRPLQTEQRQKRRLEQLTHEDQTLGCHGTRESVPDENLRKKRKRLHPPAKTGSDPSDPWDGMTRIRRRDVRIPKDQLKLLEDSPCWIPPDPGTSMPQCHVPPALLQQWNDIILRRFSRPKKGGSADSPHSQAESLPAIPSPNTRSGSDFEESASWSLSPSYHYQPRPPLPPDSSPPRRGNVPTKAVEQYENQDAVLAQHSSNNALKGEQHQPNDESEESDMDISVPHPLQSISQQSEPSGEVSSGHSLPSQKPADEVQVVETPAADFERLRAKRSDGDTPYQKAKAHHHSSQSTKFSVESRILATYGSSLPETLEPTQPPPIARGCPSASDSQLPNDSLDTRDSMLNSQVSLNSNSQSQQHEIQESQHERQIIQQRTEYSEQRRTDVSSKNHPPPEISNSEGESTDEPSAHHSLSGDHAKDDVEATSFNHPRDESRTDEVSCSEPCSEQHTDRASDEEKNDSPKKATPVMLTGQQNLWGGSNLIKAQRAYDKFRRDYPVYPGDFRHFTRMCAKLDTLRARGELQRSFLWDDFIIRHLEDYPRHLEACVSAVEEPYRYEDYFIHTFSKPLYKKRSLTATAVEASAANCIPSRASFSDSFTAQGGVSNSFSGSLVNQLSRLRTSSFQDTTDRDALGAASISNQASFSQKPRSRITASQLPEQSDSKEVATDAGYSTRSLPGERGNQASFELTETDDDDDEGTQEYHETASVEL